ncbi:hypothetical protein AB0M20_34665 [Actinoplanes sp. NPDC051633]|uniref:DUF6197 family protein n=1 Tax=Actinoplanes sp. NPDC051633 TaxID=3155670 RepID=UPI003425DF6E
MHATQPQGGASPDPISITLDQFAAYLNGTVTDEQLRASIASATDPATSRQTPPEMAEDVGYTVTETGGRVLDAAPTAEAPAAVAPAVEAPAVEAPGTAASVLRSAAVYLERHGWIQGAYYDPSATVFTPAADMAGAIGMVCYGGPVEAPAQHFDDPGFLDFEEAMLHLDRFLLVENGSQSYEFNDAKGRRAEDVIGVLREAAARPAEELIDALRVIDTEDADRATLVRLLIPCGWREPVDQPMVHVGQHVPGSRWGCPRCQAECFCLDGIQCVHCVLQFEQDATDDLIPGELYTCTECFTQFVYDDVLGTQCECADPLPSGDPDGGDAR